LAQLKEELEKLNRLHASALSSEKVYDKQRTPRSSNLSTPTCKHPTEQLPPPSQAPLTMSKCNPRKLGSKEERRLFGDVITPVPLSPPSSEKLKKKKRSPANEFTTSEKENRVSVSIAAVFVMYFNNNNNIFSLFHNSHVADTPQTNSVMIYIASVLRKRFVYTISLNQPKYTVDDQSSARP